MNFLFASDSFKGSLSSMEINGILTRCAERVFSDAACQSIAIADGGEGTLDAVLAQKNGKRVTVAVKDPLYREIKASYAALEDAAVVCMAEASGLPLLKEEERDPTQTTTYGTGELIRHALESGYRHIIVAIGGSATNDGGIGAMSALGVSFLDSKGNKLQGIGADLERIAALDVSALCPLVREAKFTVMCDVENPLCGEKGATYTFGEQKGATPEMQERLERGMQRYAAVLGGTFGVDVNAIRGGGAAGGLGAALRVFLNAEMQSGIDVILDLARFDELLQNADVVFSGEGRIDWQSACGKVISGIGKRCQRAGKPLVCLAGSLGQNAEAVYDVGVTSMFSIMDKPMTLDVAIADAATLLESSAMNLFRTIKHLSAKG